MKPTLPGKTPLQTKAVLLWGGIALGVCLLVAGIVAAVMIRSHRENAVQDFQRCKEYGGSIVESYPERCYIYGRSFSAASESELGVSGEYIGLGEMVAKDKAKTAGIPARVVERDGEALPVTMDYVPGRLNFSVRNGFVYHVEIEGTAKSR
jgi:hypothetical protein